MKKQITSRDIQRVDFVDSLYKSLKTQAKEASVQQHRWIKMAEAYISDGMDEAECVELLMIDGLSRNAAEGFTHMAIDKCEDSDLHEYIFKFEDTFGKVWSSTDIGKIVRASSDDDAWEKAEEIIFSENMDFEPERVVSVEKAE